MKIEKYNAGALTNFEVLEFLKSRGASKDPSRVMAPIAPSEFKVYDYLVESAACNQTKEIVDEFLEKCRPFHLAKAETLNILNIRPSQPSQIYPIIEKADDRFGEEGLKELVEMVVEVLPDPPFEPKFIEETAEEANADDETAEMANADEENATEENAIANEEIATEDKLLEAKRCQLGVFLLMIYLDSKAQES